MNGSVGYANTDANGLKEAKELRAYETHLRGEFLIRKHGSKERGKAAHEAEKQARR